MAAPQLLHPTLGRSVKNGATDTCSKCGHTIPEEHVPLILWNDTGDLMWVYCADCDGGVLTTLQRRASP
jgi:hypothetical protein